MKSKLLALKILFLIFLVFFAAITMADVSDTVTIDVNITQTASITVWPDTLNWTSVGTGHAGSETVGIKKLTVKNAGSVNISQIYAYINTLTTENARPYGSDTPTDFSAGGVITLRNETDSGFFFAGRIEWNWTQDIPNHDWSAVTSPKAWGYFRNTSNDYVWVLGNGTNGLCNNTGAQFAIEDDVDLGTTTTRTPIITSITRDGGDSSWSYFSIDRASSPLDGSCVAAYYDCTKIYIYHYDKRTSPNFDACTNSAYLQEANLTPGNTMTIDVDAWIPNGYPAGFLNQTTLTVYASSAI